MPYIIQTIINTTYYIFGVVSSFGQYLLQPLSYDQQEFILDIVQPFGDDFHAIIDIPLGDVFDGFTNILIDVLPFDVTGLPFICVLVLVLFIFGLVVSLLKRFISLF